MQWTGVMPAITTQFNTDLSIDYLGMEDYCGWLVDQGCNGVVTPGSLGEGATLSFDEKVKLWKTIVKALGNRVPVVAAISALSTQEAVSLAQAAEAEGCQGLMLLPPYVYPGDWIEMRAYMGAVLKATRLSCMLYNNPIAYGTDFLPEQVFELASRYENLHAVKESSGDIRRITAIRALLQNGFGDHRGDRLAVFVGIDDMIVEGIQAGAVGWIAGLADALPRESVQLFEWARTGKLADAMKLYHWFLPLLRLDTGPKFVQLIKVVQHEVGKGSTVVRPPRLELSGTELQEAKELIKKALSQRPAIGG